MITQTDLKELLYYHPESGDFVWQIKVGRAAAGTQAGTMDNGYIRIKIGKKKYRASRLAWLYMTGVHPEKQIDHRNLSRHHNEWANLREADGVQQNANKRTQRNNRVGIRGVSLWKDKWRAVIYARKKRRFLGYFKTKVEAAAAYKAAAQIQFGEFARGLP